MWRRTRYPLVLRITAEQPLLGLLAHLVVLQEVVEYLLACADVLYFICHVTLLFSLAIDAGRYGDVVYLIPREDNTFLGFSKAQLKQLLCKSGGTDKDYYLSQFVILFHMPCYSPFLTCH